MPRGINGPYARHLRHPGNGGEIEGRHGESPVRNGTCGDPLRPPLRIRNDPVRQARFRALRFGATLPSSSTRTEMPRDRTLERVTALDGRDVPGALEGIPERRIHSSRLAGRAAALALGDDRLRGGREAKERGS